MFDPKDENGAIAATQRIFATDTLRDTLRLNARAEAERWGWRAATQQLQGFYQTVVASTQMPMAA